MSGVPAVRDVKLARPNWAASGQDPCVARCDCGAGLRADRLRPAGGGLRHRAELRRIQCTATSTRPRARFTTVAFRFRWGAGGIMSKSEVGTLIRFRPRRRTTKVDFVVRGVFVYVVARGGELPHHSRRGYCVLGDGSTPRRRHRRPPQSVVARQTQHLVYPARRLSLLLPIDKDVRVRKLVRELGKAINAASSWRDPSEARRSLTTTVFRTFHHFFRQQLRSQRLARSNDGGTAAAQLGRRRREPGRVSPKMSSLKNACVLGPMTPNEASPPPSRSMRAFKHLEVHDVSHLWGSAQKRYRHLLDRHVAP